MSDPVRYRLISSRGDYRSRHVWGDVDSAREAADGMRVELGVPVLVCEAAPDGIVRHLFTVDGSAARRTVRRAG